MSRQPWPGWRVSARISPQMLKPAAQHRIQGVAITALEPAALHAVVLVGVSD